MSEADLVIGNEEYDEEEIDRRRTLVLNNPHLYLTKKKNLKDAAIIARKKCNPSVLDLCGIRVKQQNSNGLTVNLSGNLEVPDHSYALDWLKPTGVIQAVELDSRATTICAMLKKAMFERFFKRYHPLHAYRAKVGREAERKHFYFSYLY